MRNTFLSLCSVYQLLSKAFERDAVKETRQIKAFFPSPSLTAVLVQGTADVGDESAAENTVQGRKVRMTSEDML